VEQVPQFLMIYGTVFWFDIVHFAMEIKNYSKYFTKNEHSLKFYENLEKRGKISF